MKPSKKTLAFLLCLVLPLLFSLIPPTLSPSTSNYQLFRPFYEGYGDGSVTLGSGQNASINSTTGITREWNFEGWNVSDLTMQFRWLMTWGDYWFCGGYINPFKMNLYFSLDRGETFNISREIIVDGFKFHHDRTWEGGWLYADFYYTFPESDYELFTPETRLKFNRSPSFIFGIAVYLQVATVYWSENQIPVPPHDFRDELGGYGQYYMLFHVEYEEETITYTGETYGFLYEETLTKLEDSASMILNTNHPSGVLNEVVITDIPFGRTTWIVLYSSELACVELLELCKINQISNETRNDYLLTVKRFINYLFSKQNLTDGSFPFILTDGDQHCWYNETSEDYYGYDKIDSFSALSISLMREYHDATNDTAFINQTWGQITLSKDFIVSLMNLTYWLPVDGYHYNGTHYVKSEMNWLHDCCEAERGIRDFAYLNGIRGDSSEESYWNTYADSIANGIRTHFWNETLSRYSGMFYVNNGTQNTARVYNIITPVIYQIENNVTRAYLTTEKYSDWGLLSGRYYEVKWAEDFSIFNEYSTMSGMIYSSFNVLVNDFNYSQAWQKTKFIEVSKFLFLNPIYPPRNLQNEDGFLDYVNLVNYTYAQEYARLIEGSSWFINGFTKIPNMTALFTYSETELAIINQTLAEESIYWNQMYDEFHSETGLTWNSSQLTLSQWEQWLKQNGSYVQWYDHKFLEYLLDNEYLNDTTPWWEDSIPDDWLYDVIYFPSWVDEYTMFALGLSGLILMVASPSWVAWQIRRKGLTDNAFERGMYALLLFCIGFGLLIIWLW